LPLHAANRLGRTLRPVPPVLDARDVAERIVGLALRPRRALHLGAHQMLVPVHALVPETAGRLLGWAAERFLRQSGPAALATDGALLMPVAQGTGTGIGWGAAEQRRAARFALGMAAGLMGVAGVMLARRGGRRALPPSSMVGR
jgi:hypothetical protein